MHKAATFPLRDEMERAERVAGFRFVAIDVAGVQPGTFTLPMAGVCGG